MTLAIPLYYILPKCLLTFRTPAVEYFTSTLAEVGFKIGGVYTLLDELLIKPEVYTQKDGPFDEKWRNMDRYCESVFIQSPN